MAPKGIIGIKNNKYINAWTLKFDFFKANSSILFELFDKELWSIFNTFTKKYKFDIINKKGR